MIDRLNPPPANLRSRADLHLTEDKARFKIIRDGHLGSGMFPDHTLTDQDIKDLLVYFSLLRRHAPVPENALTDCPATNLISRHAFFSGLAPVCQREKICGSTDTFLITLRLFLTALLSCTSALRIASTIYEHAS